jgi:potassium-dependent mechanosensitive channel
VNEAKDLWSQFVNIWTFQIMNVDGQPITVGKLVVGLVLLVLGFMASKALSRGLRRRVLSRFDIEPSLQATWQTFSFYIIYALVVLFVLQLLHIPITIFAVVGGALAIGIGFGSQNIVSNFISGLIVMVERPVRLGDLVEIDSLLGTIEVIGTRSTIMRTLDNKQVIIPNSHFLDKAFINWTLSDMVISGKIEVGVAYGSDVNKVRDILVQAAGGHAMVMKSPAPTVVFTNFGESSLDFELVYWLKIDLDYGIRRIGSEIRYQILDSFAKHNVSIPFPHRELILKGALAAPMSAL